MTDWKENKRKQIIQAWKLIFGEPPKEHKVREKSKWIGITPCEDWQCDYCGFIVDDVGKRIKEYNFCPHCGRRMIFEEDSE